MNKYCNYEADIPWENDPELEVAGVAVRARVNVDLKLRSHNRIVFARGNRPAEVQCVHTAVYAGAQACKSS